MGLTICMSLKLWVLLVLCLGSYPLWPGGMGKRLWRCVATEESFSLFSIECLAAGNTAAWRWEPADVGDYGIKENQENLRVEGDWMVGGVTNQRDPRRKWEWRADWGIQVRGERNPTWHGCCCHVRWLLYWVWWLKWWQGLYLKQMDKALKALVCSLLYQIAEMDKFFELS